MNPKRSLLFLAAVAAAFILFYLFLNVPLPSPVSSTDERTAARGPAEPADRLAVTSLSYERSADSRGFARPQLATPGEQETSSVPSAPPVESRKTSATTDGATASMARAATTPAAPRSIEELARTLEPLPERARPVEESRERPSRVTPVVHTESVADRPLNALTSPVGEGVHASTVETGAAVSGAAASTARVPANASDTPDRRRPYQDTKTDAQGTLGDDASALEKLLAARKSTSRRPGTSERRKRPAENLVEELERLLESDAPHAASTPPVSVAASVPSTALVPSAAPVPESDGLPPREPPRTIGEWRARRRQYRELARDGDTDRASAVFRLEQPDAGSFGAVMEQYRMDVLLEAPPLGTYSIVPHGGDYWDRTTFRMGERDLRVKYGLAVRHLALPWLDRLRETHVATELVSAESVDVAVLVPKEETEILLGNIVAGCRALGHPLEDVAACYGRFVERVLSGQRIFDYEVTRIVLRDGTRIDHRL